MKTKKWKRVESQMQSFQFKKLLIEYGRFKSKGIVLDEACINKLVLRILLPELDEINKKTAELLKNKGRINGIGNSRKQKKTKSKVKKSTRSNNNNKIQTFNERRIKEKFRSELNNERLTLPAYLSDEDLIPNRKLLKKNPVAFSQSSYMSLRKIKQSSLKRKINEEYGRPLLLKRKKYKQPIRPPSSFYYYLKYRELCIYQKPGKMNFDFNILIGGARTMKLPSRDWRIKMMVHNGLVAFISLTNGNEKMERSVTFSQKNPYYKIIIDGEVVSLLGSPISVDCMHDIEVLIDIVHNISSDDCMIFKQ